MTARPHPECQRLADYGELQEFCGISVPMVDGQNPA